MRIDTRKTKDLKAVVKLYRDAREMADHEHIRALQRRLDTKFQRGC